MAWTYAALRAEVLARCQGLTDAEAAALLSADRIHGRRDVSPSDARQVLLVRGEWAKAIILSRTIIDENTSGQMQEMIGAAITLVEALNPQKTTALMMTEEEDWVATQGMLTMLVMAGVISPESQTRLLALANNDVSPWNPLPTAADVAAARAMEAS